MRSRPRAARLAALSSMMLSAIFFTGLAGAENWPRWRGPEDNGMASGSAPVRWSDTGNIKWKTAIPGRGHSTPVVWGDKIFLTTAIPVGKAPEPARAARGREEAALLGQQERRGRRGGGRGRRGPGGDSGPQAEHQFVLLCLDKNTGKVLWQRTAKAAVPHEGYHRTYGSFASSSPVTDGRHVFAYFGSHGIFSYDLNGNLVWEKDLGVKMRKRLGFGEGTAPVLHEDKLILKLDHEGDSFIVVLDKNSGREIWRAARDEQSSWSPPLVVEHGGRKQVITTATNRVRSYDLETGELIWECGGLGSNAIPAPVVQGDVVYVMTGHREPNLMAIKLGREGDLTDSDAVVWSNTRANSYTASPVLYDNQLYVLTDNGFISSFNAATGEPYYHQVRLPKPYKFKASPVGADGKLYLASEDGDVIVLKMGPEYEVLATNTLTDQVFISSPVIVDGELFLRSQTHLFCIREGD